MTDRQINKVLGFTPLVPTICWATITLIGVIHFGQLPKYGSTPDPSALGIEWLDGVAVIGTTVCLFTIPAWLLVTIHLINCKTKFTIAELISIAASIISISSFFIVKYIGSSAFEWVTD